MKQGILLLNFGGPWTLADVKPFLYRLFANPRVLVGIPAPLRHLLAFMIAQIKGPSSIKSYRSIGGGSPQLKWTVIQAEGLRQLLPQTGVHVEFGMRSSEPSIETALANEVLGRRSAGTNAVVSAVLNHDNRNLLRRGRRRLEQAWMASTANDCDPLAGPSRVHFSFAQQCRGCPLRSGIRIERLDSPGAHRVFSPFIAHEDRRARRSIR